MTPSAAPWALLPALFIAYHAAFLWLVQQTVGKAMFSLRVSRIDGEPTLLWALGRSSVGYFSVDVLFIGALAALFDRRHRGLHDRVFRSEVLHEPGQARRRLDRLVEFAKSSQSALEEKKERSVFKPFFVLMGFWASLEKLAGLVGKAVGAAEKALGGLGSASPAATAAPASVLPTKAAAFVVLGTTAVTGVTVAAVPPLRDAAAALPESRAGDERRGAIPFSDVDEGNCLETVPSGVVPVASVIRIDCDLRHEAEAYAVLEHDEGPFPGTAALQQEGERECGDRFEPLEDVSPELDWDPLVPYDAATWDGGYRQITCLAFRKDREPMEGSIED